MEDFWNKRYSDTEFAYGTEPNAYFKSSIEFIPKGHLLLPCEGEGRNAVFAAKSGFKVSAFDSSQEGCKKAMKLAKSNQVSIDYEVCSFEQADIKTAHYDCIALIYAHFPPNNRKSYHQKLIDGLKPGGYMIIEGFSKDNLKRSQENPKIGGPQKLELLYDKNELKDDFKSLKIVSLTSDLVELNEGKYHIGKGAVIRMIAQKI